MESALCNALLTLKPCRAGDDNQLSAVQGWSPVKTGQRLSAVAASACSLAPAAGVSLSSPVAADVNIDLSAALSGHSPEALSEYATCLGSPMTCVGTPLQSDAGTWLVGELSPLEGMLSFDNPSFDQDSGLDA